MGLGRWDRENGNSLLNFVYRENRLEECGLWLVDVDREISISDETSMNLLDV